MFALRRLVANVIKAPISVTQRSLHMAPMSQSNMIAYNPLFFQQPTPIINTTQLSVSSIDANLVNEDIVYEMLNRNKRKLKRANHGARPNNSRGRKARRLRRH